MKTIISKEVSALYPGGQLLQDEYFRSIRERLFNKDRYTRHEDTGINDKKKIIIDSPGLGSNDRGHNLGSGMGLGRDENESSDRTLSSGYNDGEQADDETGPGHKSVPNDPYYASDVFNELFLDLDLKSQDKDSIQSHLKTVLKGSPVVTPHKRYNVDSLN